MIKTKRGVIYVVSCCTCAALISIAALILKPPAGSDARSVFLALSDSFTVSGVLVFGIGALGMLAYFGAYDITRYALGRLLSVFLNSSVHEEKTGYFEYKSKRRRTPTLSVAALLTGGLFLFADGLFLCAYFLSP